MGSAGPTTDSHPRYQDIPETTADLDWAELVNIDLSQFDTPGGKQRLASQLKDAISTVGFFYVTNFGLSEAEVDEQFALAREIFDLPAEEKAKYRVDPSLPGYFGWKPRGARKQQHGLVDNLELYDDPKWNSIYADRPRPPPLLNAQAQTAHFCKHLHHHVLRRLLILSAIIMELADEDALWKLHDYAAASQCHLRYMCYHPRTPAELATMHRHRIEHNVYGHTDFGTFTLLMRQPVAALQVQVQRTPAERVWKWVRPVRGTITVNVADTLSFLTAGYLASTIHRVVLPPEDQRHWPRYGVIYFAGPDDETELRAVASPLLEIERQREREREEMKEGKEEVRKEGPAVKRMMPPEGVTAGEWVKVRFASIDANYANNRDNKVVVKSVEVESYAQ